MEEKMNKKLTYFSTIKFLSKYIKAYKINYFLFGIGWFFDIVLKLYTPIMFAVMIDEIVYYRNISVFLRISVAFAIMLLFACIVHFFTQAQYAYLEIMYSFDIKKDIFHKLQYAKADYLSYLETGDAMNTLQYYTSECMNFVIRNIIHTFNNFLALVFYIINIFIIGWQFGILMLIGVPISVYTTTKFGKKIRKCNDEYNKVYGKYSGWLLERLSGLKDIRMISAQNAVGKEFVGFHRQLFHRKNQNRVITISSQSVTKTINLIIQMAIYCLCAYLACRGKMTIGVLTIVLTYFVNVTEKVTFFSDYFIEAQKRIASIQKVYDLFHVPTEKEWKGKDSLKVSKGSIQFDHISFGYENKKELFHDFSLEIEGGQTVALVGKSGSGKTTLAYMLTGFYQQKKGKIIIDGKDISECSLKSIRESIGIVQQDVLVFDGSIKDNLLLGKKGASDEEIKEACEKAGLGEFIQSLSQGINTVIGTNGIGLSGGQMQRIAIARIYLKNPKIIIFDEATSALDRETEAYIHESWKKVLAGRTSIVIAHRISSVMLCEKTVLMEDGVLYEYGNTMELVQNSKTMRTLFAIS